MSGPPAYLPGKPPAQPTPLERFLPPHPTGSASRWLENRIPPGSLILDPFGASPSLALEIASAGYRLIVSANNPIVRLVLEFLAGKPAQNSLQAALAHLSAVRIGEERLEPHLLALYHTPCGSCGRLVSADEFLWERDASAPFARIYRCPACGHGGEFPAVPFDADRAAETAASPLTRARILERVVALKDPDRRHAEDALRHYPPRTVTALGALINKVDTFPESIRTRIAALLLVAFDQTNTLWAYPAHRPRPRQLTIPPRYRERNVFHTLERAAGVWTTDTGTAPVPVTAFPELPEGGGISLYEGRIRDLAERLPGLEVAGVVTALPRPNQAFWSLSALWAGWLEGREAVRPFKAALRRQRYDWRWHSTALHAALAQLPAVLPPETPFFALVPEAEIGLLGAALAAGEGAGLQLTGMALRPSDEQAQLHWTPAREVPAETAEADIGRVARAYLEARGEPAPLLPILAAAFSPGAGAGARAAADPSERYTALLSELETALSYRGGFTRYNAGKELDTGMWWLRDEPGTAPMADRVESEVRRLLETQPGLSLAEIDAALCSSFPGLLTPDLDLVAACLESYGEEFSADRWRLRGEDAPEARANELARNRDVLLSLGKRLGFAVDPGPPIVWSDAGARYRLHLTGTARMGEMVLSARAGTGRNLLVVPGSRANLILHKRLRDPRIDYMLRDWTFIKFRHLRALSANPALRRSNLDEQLLVDELTYESPQLKLF